MSSFRASSLSQVDRRYFLLIRSCSVAHWTWWTLASQMLIKLMLSIDAQCLWESMGQWAGPEVLSKRLSPFLHANMVTDTYMETITFIYYRFCNSFLFPLFSTKCAALYNLICPSGINKVFFFPDSDLILITEQYIVQYSIHCHWFSKDCICGI